jgi:hypothetical protein
MNPSCGDPARDPAQDAIEEGEHVGVGRDGQELEPQAWVVLDEYAVGHEVRPPDHG